jgi:hypothetical protein
MYWIDASASIGITLDERGLTGGASRIASSAPNPPLRDAQTTYQGLPIEASGPVPQWRNRTWWCSDPMWFADISWSFAAAGEVNAY